MGRTQRSVDPLSGPVAAFAAELRELREAAGNPLFAAMARRGGPVSRTALTEAAGGDHLATWRTVEAFVLAYNADPQAWLPRWERARDARDRELALAVLDGTAPPSTPQRGGDGAAPAPAPQGPAATIESPARGDTDDTGGQAQPSGAAASDSMASNPGSPSRLRRRWLVAAVVIVGGLALGGALWAVEQSRKPSIQTSALPVFSVMNTSETPPEGVWFRNSAHTLDTDRVTGHGVYAGDRVQLRCYTIGEPAGPRGDTLWYLADNMTRPTVPISNAVNAGYLNAHYINDGKPAGTADSGVPKC